ncbi:unnamed protein product [Rodentolepis nana]|uniref:DOP1-like TPR domain-containing protein n=1 Tax=Rodentolepis nana TaxID=102285 RepID=A0A3P7WAG2_RODNA|nr:unnamed protein product [Rodentolepis nana]
MAYLVAGSALSTDFDTKTICLHTILDLIEASTSIHGWTACVADQRQPGENGRSHVNPPPKQSQWGPSGLLLPILSKEVLNTLASTLDFFSSGGSKFKSSVGFAAIFLPITSYQILRRFNVWEHLGREISGGGVGMANGVTAITNGFCSLPLCPPVKISAVTLWSFLNDSSYAEDAASLILRVISVSPHNTFASTEAVVENFFVQQCLLILLDGLEATSPTSTSCSGVGELSKAHELNCTNDGTDDDHVQFEIRQITKNWLVSALSGGQAGRILAPLFATLLHPSTARTSLVSIRSRRRRLRMAKKRRNRRRLRQSVNPRNSDVDGQTKETDGGLFSGDESEDADEGYEDFDADLELEDGDLNDYDYDEEWEEYDRNICALSGGSPSGEVHFYVSNRPSQASPKESGAKRKKRLGVFSKTPILRRKKKGAGGDGTGNAVGGDVFDEEYHPVDVMTRLQNSGNRNNDVNGMKVEERISLDRIRRDVIQGLLAELLKPASDDGETLTSRSQSPFDQMIALPVKVLPIHEHLLVYLHKYDFNQVMYAFTRLRAILKSDAASAFLLALAATPTTARRSTSSLSKTRQEVPHFATSAFPQLFGTSLIDLLARHLRCLSAGGCDDFARHATADELCAVSDQRMRSLLDVLLHVCISFHVSLVLPDVQCPLNQAANSNVRLIAAQVLQLITEVSAAP